MKRIARLGPAALAAAFGVFGMMALNDVAVASALGGRPVSGPSILPGAVTSSDRVNVTVINNHGLGGGGGPGRAPSYINTGTLSVPWWGGQHPPQSQGAARYSPPLGWQNRFNAPRPDGR